MEDEPKQSFAPPEANRLTIQRIPPQPNEARASKTLGEQTIRRMGRQVYAALGERAFAPTPALSGDDFGHAEFHQLLMAADNAEKFIFIDRLADKIVDSHGGAAGPGRFVIRSA